MGLFTKMFPGQFSTCSRSECEPRVENFGSVLSGPARGVGLANLKTGRDTGSPGSKERREI